MSAKTDGQCPAGTKIGRTKPDTMNDKLVYYSIASYLQPSLRPEQRERDTQSKPAYTANTIGK